MAEFIATIAIISSSRKHPVSGVPRFLRNAVEGCVACEKSSAHREKHLMLRSGCFREVLIVPNFYSGGLLE